MQEGFLYVIYSFLLLGCIANDEETEKKKNLKWRKRFEEGRTIFLAAIQMNLEIISL